MSKSMVSLSSCIDKAQSHVLNASDESKLVDFIDATSSSALHSDADVDHQMLLSIAFQNNVKVHSISFKADEFSGVPEEGKTLLTQKRRHCVVFLNCLTYTTAV